MQLPVKHTVPTAIAIERPVIIPLLVMLFFFTLLGGVAILYAVFYAIFIVVLLSFLWTWILARGLWLTRQPSVGNLYVGSQLEELFVAENTAIVPASYIEIADHSNFPGYSASRIEAIGPRQTKRWHVYWRCRRRGIYHLGPLTVRAGDPFGFFSVRQEYTDTITFLVLPPVVDIGPVDLPRGALAGSSSGAVRVLQVTSTASSVRAYQPGDSVKRIHWPTTARRGELFVKDYDLERSSDLWILLDLDKQTLFGSEEESTEEYAVRIAVGLANKVLREGRAAGLIAYGKEETLVAPETGGDQFNRMLVALAGVHNDGDRSLAQVLPAVESIMGRGGTVAVITASGQVDWIRSVALLSQRSLSPIVFLIDQSTFGGPVKGMSIIQEVLRSNITCHLVQRGHRFRIISGTAPDTPKPRILARGYRKDFVAPPR